MVDKIITEDKKQEGVLAKLVLEGEESDKQGIMKSVILGYTLALEGSGSYKRLWSVGIEKSGDTYLVNEFVDDHQKRFRDVCLNELSAKQVAYKIVRSVGESYKKQLGLPLEDRTSYSGKEISLPVRKR